MSFSERYGYKPPPVAQIESMDVGLRNMLWTLIDEQIWHVAINRGQFSEFVGTVWTRFFKQRHDTLKSQGTRQILERFLELEWFGVLDFMEYIASFSGDPPDFRRRCNQAFAAENAGYRFVGPTIAPISELTDQVAVESALEALRGIPAARAHLAHALELLGKRPDPDFRNSIKESISSVEALAQWITGDPKATLGAALAKIPNLHGALSKSLSALYGWTSDADGIRHAMQDEPNLNAEDARFMLVTCSAFCSYLVAKAAHTK